MSDSQTNGHDYEGLPEGFVPGSDNDINVLGIVFIGIIGAVLTVVIIIWLKALFYTTSSQEAAAKLAQYSDVKLSDVVSAAQTQLNGYRWVDPKAGTLAIPIDRAMQMVLLEHAGEGEPGRVVREWGKSDQSPTPGDVILLGADPSMGIGVQRPSEADLQRMHPGTPGGRPGGIPNDAAGAVVTGIGKTTPYIRPEQQKAADEQAAKKKAATQSQDGR